MLKKYERLCAKYDEAVRKLERNAAHEIGVYQLGGWALRTSTSGLALVRKGSVIMTNRRWQELDTPRDARRWELIAPSGPPSSYGSLREVAVVSAAQILASRAPSQVARYRRGTQVMEVWSERLNGGNGVSLLIHDVSEQIRAEAELRTAREALHRRHRLEGIGELASGIAHDLNNALNVMRLRIDLLERDLKGPAQRKHVDALARIVEDAAARVARVHDLSRKQEDGRIDAVELQQIVAEAVALARTELEQHEMIGGRRFRLVTRVPELPPVQANPAELKHVFVNLIFNARDAMPLGGTITIDGRREADLAVITVADEGTGIADDDLDRIFDPFFTTKGQSGTGLGLSMARGAMARMGGSISARNRESGGAEFLLRFPLAIGRPVAAEAPHPAGPPAAIARDVRMLLVDDDADCLEVTAEVLQRDGVTVDQASSGSAALEKLEHGHYDLLLCDVGMPEMSGWEVARRSRERRPGMAIYMMTGWAEEFVSSGTHPVSVEGVLGKPLELDELHSIVADVARRPAAPGPSEVPDKGDGL